jgi:outer membrane receptor protein involved in Fe transport
MSKKVSFPQWMLLLLMMMFTVAAFAQTTASIKGTVTDQTGAAVVGAKVTIKNTALGIERTAQTNSSGDYEVPALPPGSYSVEIQMTGFQPQQANNLELAVSQNSVQNFNLKVATSTEVVTVEATAPLIETTTMTVGQSIDQRTVQEIPLNGRHFVDLGLLIPGSVTPPQNGFLTAPLRGQGSFAFNTAGNREDTVNFMVNGINLNDMVQNQITFQPSINTVSEFKVDNSTYSAEYGRNSGAIVNIATRSGSNAYHGELFEFLRNEALDARNFFNTKFANGLPNHQATFKRNQFGANFGGPIVRDKTFFFLSYEALRQRQGIVINTPVLSDVQRQQVVTAGNPTSVKLLQLIPSANSGNNFVGSATAPVDIDQGTADISHNLTSNVRLHAYYAGQHDLRQEPTLQGNNIPAFGDTRESKRQIATFSVDQTFSANLVNEARLGFNRIHITFSPNAKQDPAAFGINDGLSGPVGLPQIVINGVGNGLNFGGPGGFPQGRGDTTAVLADTLNYLHGKHSFKFGGEFRRFYNNNFNSDRGTLVFDSVTDPNPLRSQFANGTASSFNLSPGNNPSRIGTGELGFFAQDSWKLFSRFTLELGLRYDWNQTPGEALNRFANFIPSTDSLVRTASPYKQNNLNFQPRLGFAWDLFGSGKTVIRSGYALLTDQPITNLVTPLTNNQPFGNPVAFNGPGTATYANLLTAAAANGLAPTVVDPNFKNSYIQSFNLNIQQQLASKWSVMVGYFGSVGRDLRTRENLNQFIGGVRPFAHLSATSPILPGAAVGNISANESNGNSSYNALWITSNLSTWHGLQFNASYTYSKSLDDTSQNGQGFTNLVSGLQNSFNPGGDKGLSDYDARNRFSMNFIYAVPSFRHDRFFDGWQLGSIIQAQSGNPVNIFANAAGISGLTGFSTLRPDQIGSIQLLGAPAANGSIQWFVAPVCDPVRAPAGCAGATFAIPNSGTATNYHFGNYGRNSLIGPGFTNVDFSIIKRTKITERFSNELRLEAFDLFNHPNFGQPNRVAQLVGGVSSPSFGQITTTRFQPGDSGSARQLQFAIKLLF